MLNCDINSGVGRACKKNIGGNSKLYIFNYIDNPFTVANGVATAINPNLTEVFEFEIIGDTNPVVESLVSDRNSGTSVNTQTLTAQLIGINAEKSALLSLLAYGFPMAVSKDRNGVYKVIGIDDGIDFTVEENTGSAKTDFAGYTLTGTSTTGALSPKLDEDTIAEFLALVVPNEGTYTFTATPAVVNGAYADGVALDDSNSVDVEVTVTELGDYFIDTNLENGYSFSATGKFTALGTQLVSLQGVGTPTTAQTDNFTASGRVGAGDIAFQVTVS